MRNFKDLTVWQKSHRMVLDVYRVSKGFPSDERFGLTAQLRRSAVSVPANIAEGCGRDTDREMARFLSIAAGSACETEYYIILAHDLSFIDKNAYDELDRQINEIKRMLNSFMQKLMQKTGPKT